MTDGGGAEIDRGREKEKRESGKILGLYKESPLLHRSTYLSIVSDWQSRTLARPLQALRGGSFTE